MAYPVTPLMARVSEIADDVGRLRRLGYASHILDRLANHVESLDGMVRPTAAELYREGLSVDDAIGVVESERAECRQRLAS